MEFHKPSEWLGLLWKTYRGPSRKLSPCEQANMEDLFGRDLSKIVSEYRGQWYCQKGLHYLKAKLRRIALRGLLSSLLLTIRGRTPEGYEKDYFRDKPIIKPLFYGDDSYAPFVPPEVDVFLTPNAAHQPQGKSGLNENQTRFDPCRLDALVKLSIIISLPFSIAS
jgi:hypothetical protein